ncbi:MAG: cold-shock protein [Olivibacter sp.]|jgi:CspA family cold shock protein|uniref:Cold-shock protein DNA-binding protein n=1 Tax=Sphingobacterium sp. (strain 21) TaxID=743722 RepID=F4C2T7_SPHS2|nr:MULTISPECIES: cold-shock protein [Olivibacter]MCL4642045.1 cold-shock protein [Olivibacter sp. UJ_SKK_5.1]MDM8173292.1 cold-shock protein [Olivibacter sp. 47]QEL03073.1 cold-shock protein [Olivibacter sp. LS-1]
MQEGIVRIFNGSRGFGFTIPQRGKIHENDQVTYKVVQRSKGLSAIELKIA